MFDIDSNLSTGKKKEPASGRLFLSGGLEGDRTIEPHGCEPCALSDWAVIGVFDEAGVILLRIIIIETYKPLPNIK